MILVGMFIHLIYKPMEPQIHIEAGKSFTQLSTLKIRFERFQGSYAGEYEDIPLAYSAV
jgi:hypothetical protein